MAMFVNTNVSSLQGQNNLNNINKKLDTTYQRLSSGLRINGAKDDAAGLQIANRMTSQINGLNQGNRNANDGISLAQTAEGSLDEIGNMLQRVRTLSQQSANSTNSSTDRSAMQKEVDQLTSEINRVAEQTSFAGISLLDGEAAATGGSAVQGGGDKNFDFQVGAYANQTISFDLGLTGGSAGSLTGLSFRVSDMKIAAGAAGTPVSLGGTGMGSTGSIDVSTKSAAQATLANVDKMIAVVDGKRADLGASMNRMDSAVRNNETASANVSDARSRVRDADFAVETANLTQFNILQQAASTVLAQSNQRPQAALSLLG